MLTIGWIGSALLSVCGGFQAYRAWKDGYCNLDKLFVQAWLWGELFTLAYVLHRQDWPMVFNMSTNLISLAIIIKYNKKEISNA